tara:strand:- start:50 stop:358 length:309 start_codon:yes stop_codon:yes gene_type:complete
MSKTTKQINEILEKDTFYSEKNNQYVLSMSYQCPNDYDPECSQQYYWGKMLTAKTMKELRNKLLEYLSFVPTGHTDRSRKEHKKEVKKYFERQEKKNQKIKN